MDKSKKKREKKIILLIQAVAIITLLCLLLCNVLMLSANFSIDQSELEENVIRRPVSLPSTLRYTSISKNAISENWKIYKNDSKDTLYFNGPSFDLELNEIGTYVIELKVFGKNKNKFRVKKLILELSKSFVDDKVTKFKNVFREHLDSDFDRGELIDSRFLNGIVNTNNINMTIFDRKGNEMSDADVVKKGNVVSVESISLEKFKMNDKGEFIDLNVIVNFSEREPELIEGKTVNPFTDIVSGYPFYEEKDQNEIPLENYKPSVGIGEIKEGPKIANCLNMKINLPLSIEGFNVDNLSDDVRVYKVNEEYEFGYENCNSNLTWSFNGFEKEGPSVSYAFANVGKKKICLGGDCTDVLVTYSARVVEEKFNQILDGILTNSQIPDLVEGLKKLMEDPNNRGAIDLKSQQLNVDSWVGKQIILKPKMLPEYELTIDADSGKIKRINFR